MYNLMNFNPRKELIDFENAYFVFDTKGQFSLNEKEEKIWSYLVTEEDKTLPVIFQLMWFEQQLCISYTTKHPHESIRQKASQMAHRIRAVLRQKVKAPLLLEHPIIANFELYEKNQSQAPLAMQVDRLCQQVETYTTNAEHKTAFTLYGEDGKMLGQMLEEEKVATITPKEDLTYELLIRAEMTVQQREEWMQTVQQFGYGITYQEIEVYDKTTMMDLFSSGLIQIEKA